MDNTPYAPPRAVVADIASGPSVARPWQVRVAMALCWLSAVLTIPGVINDIHGSVPGHLQSTSFFAAMAAAAILVFALLALLFVFLGRGYRWARVVFSIVTLLDVVSRTQALSAGSERAWYWSAQGVLMCLLGVAALVLLFTGPANAWFRTRGGRIEVP